jgi:hypothetical protein
MMSLHVLSLPESLFSPQYEGGTYEARAHNIKELSEPEGGPKQSRLGISTLPDAGSLH